MEDGGMGSLKLIPPNIEDANRIFGMRVSEIQFLGKDGIDVSVQQNHNRFHSKRFVIANQTIDSYETGDDP